MVLTGSDEASIVLSVTSDVTRLKLHYKCVREEGGLFSLSFSPLWLALWFGVWTLLIGICCLSTCWIVRHRRNRGRLPAVSMRVRRRPGTL